MTNTNKLLNTIKLNPESIEFDDVIEVIAARYNYTPTQFSNGLHDDSFVNKAGENEGSCKIFSFALLQELDEKQTLNCFGQYYRDDVLNNPDNTDHTNIRTFIKYGWKGINFDAQALSKK